MPEGFTGTRLTACNLCEAICGLELTLTDGEGHRRSAATPTTRCRGAHLPQGRGAGRRATTTPTGCAGRSAGRSATTVGGDRLGRGARPRRRRAGRRPQPSTAATPSASTSATPTRTRSARRPTAVPFVKSLRTRNRFSASSVDQLPAPAAWRGRCSATSCCCPIPDLDRTSYFLVLRRQPDGLQRLADDRARLPAPGRGDSSSAAAGSSCSTRAAPRPRRSPTEHLFVRPGSDAVVLLAMLHVLFAEGLAASPGVRRRARRAARARRRRSPRSAPSRSAACPPTTVRRLAREFAAADGAAAYGRLGVSDAPASARSASGRSSCLNLLAGNFDRPGGVLFPEPAVDVVGRGFVGTRPLRPVPQPGPRTAGVRRRAAGRRACARRSRRRATGRSARCVTIAGNPVLSTPDGTRLGEAFDSLDFMAAIDIYLNETTRHADVILPPTTALERDHYDLVFHGLAVRNTARFTPAVFAKPDGRPARLGDLPRADRCGSPRGCTGRRPLKAPARAAAAAAAQPHPAARPAAAHRPRYDAPGSCARTPRASTSGRCGPTMPGRLQTEDHRIDLAPAARRRRPRRGCEAGCADRPDDALLLIGRRHKQDNNSWFHNTDPADPRPAAAPAADAPRRPGRARDRRRRARARSPRAVGSVRGRGGGHRRHDAAAWSRSPTATGTRSTAPGCAHAAKVAGVSINDLTDPELLDVAATPR